MSIEIRIEHETKPGRECDCNTVQPVGYERACVSRFVCDWGEFKYSDPRPDIGEVGHLMVVGRDYFHNLIKHGSRRRANGGIDSATLTTADISEDVTPDSVIRMFFNCQYGEQRWTWELFDAHWWDGPDPRVYVGRWPD